jgi:hypothetical protein
LVSAFSRVSTVPLGSMAKAALVGANTVNGPSPCRVGTRPAAFTAATRVVWSFEATALSTMVFDGYIAAPPTITVVSAWTGRMKLDPIRARPREAAIVVIRIEVM